MTPEEMARVKIDKQLYSAGWDIVSRDEFIPMSTVAVKEALMQGNTESDYLLFIDNKAIAVLEAKREENQLGDEVAAQAEGYATHPQGWYGLWLDKLIPLVYMANGNKILFKNMLADPNGEYAEISDMHSPKKMLQMIGAKSEYGALPYLQRKGLRDCQYYAEINLENALKSGEKKNLAVLATGSGKTYLACLASYRLLNYTSTKRVLFLVDRNNLARQTETEFSLFDRTERQQPMSNLYMIKRLKKESDVDADIVISTIQKLFAVLTGQQLIDGNEDAEDEEAKKDEDKANEEAIQLGNDLKLPPDYFQFIVVDECHRSIYGKWRAVLDYFSEAKILGLTATPTPEAYAFFNNNIVENYSYDDSVVDGVNVPARVYRIETEVTEYGGSIEKGSKVVEIAHKTGQTTTYKADANYGYTAQALDRSVVNRDQIRKVLTAYKEAIYTDLYPEREKKWEYVPKTLIFAKDDNHASEIVTVAREVFKPEFDGNVPENFVQKITYSAGDSNALIRDLRTEKEFRIAVTVTLVATGTDVRPLEVVLFMRDVASDVLYTQMKGRGCRTIKDDKLREVTPNADTKECYYIVDAVGVTEHDHDIPGPGPGPSKKTLSLVQLLEHLAHGEVSDENLLLLRNYCATINKRYEDDALFGKHLSFFITEFGFAPRTLANSIQDAIENSKLLEYEGPSGNNASRLALIAILMNDIKARNKLIEMQKGYSVSIQDEDTVIYAGFSKETAKSYIDNFEKFINDNKDSIEALRIIYNSEDVVITHKMLVELRDRLLSENRQYGVYQLWKSYKILDEDGNVDELDIKHNVNALTNLIQIVRYAYGKNQKLTSLVVGYSQRFSLYCGQNQRVLTEDQIDIMKMIAEYVINNGAISAPELNS
ncbi:MAG: DEAD/DEAH box helicase family protein, partial [Eubacterium sp.]|nr:DEAD/DEAH box helicase family protein [Eubacterium sp.]